MALSCIAQFPGISWFSESLLNPSLQSSFTNLSPFIQAIVTDFKQAYRKLSYTILNVGAIHQLPRVHLKYVCMGIPLHPKHM